MTPTSEMAALFMTNVSCRGLDCSAASERIDMSKKFAKMVYIYRSPEETDECLVAHEKLEEACALGEKRAVAIYELKEIITVEGIVRITRQKRN